MAVFWILINKNAWIQILILELPSLLSFLVILAYFFHSLFSSQINYFHTFHDICFSSSNPIFLDTINSFAAVHRPACYSYLSHLLKHTVLSVLSSAFLPGPSLTVRSLQPFLATIHTAVVLLTHYSSLHLKIFEHKSLFWGKIGTNLYYYLLLFE